MITIENLNVGDKFTTYITHGTFKVLKILKDENESICCNNSNDNRIHIINNNDLKKLNIKLI